MTLGIYNSIVGRVTDEPNEEQNVFIYSVLLSCSSKAY
jgi:hypothetical protein